MKFRHILFTGAILFSCQSNDEKTEDPDYPIVKSVLQSVHEPSGGQNDVTYHPYVLENSVIMEMQFNRKGQLLKETISDADGLLKSKVIYKYDRHGNPIQWDKYMPNGWLTSKTTSEYNKANQLVERYEIDATDMVISHQRAEYADGKQWLVTYQKVNGKLVKTLESAFDKRGHNILNNHFMKDILEKQDTRAYTIRGEQTQASTILLTRGIAVPIRSATDNNLGVDNYQASGTLKMQEELKYDVDGNLVETWQRFPQTNKQNTIRYKYDKGRMEVVRLSDNQMVSSKKLVRYDDKQNVVETFRYSIVGRLEEHQRHLYEYDPAGNWIIHKTIINNKSRTVVVRKIEYF